MPKLKNQKCDNWAILKHCDKINHSEKGKYGMVFQLRKWLSIAFTFARVSHLLKKGFATDIFPATWLTSFTNLIRQIELEMLLFVYTWKLIRYARHLQHYQMFPQAKIWYMSNECIIGKKSVSYQEKIPFSWLSIKWQMLSNQEERFLFPRVCRVPRYFCNQTLVIGTLLGSLESTGITRCASSHQHRVLICPIYPPLQE